MRTINRHLAALIILTAAALAYTAAVYPTFINYAPHFFSSNDCIDCHFTVPSPGEPRPFRFNRPITTLCMRCHAGLHPLSHVVDVVPSMAMPPGMPLDGLGMMTCATCHDPHRNRIDSHTGERTYYLRVDKVGKEFCLLCHNTPSRPGDARIFAPGGGITHRRSMTLSHGFANLSDTGRHSTLDPLSKLCVSCHGGGEENADVQKLGSGVWVHGSGIGLSHPVGVDYYNATRRHDKFVPMDRVDQRIKFFDGRVGCCSCHDPYSKGGGQGLVMSDDGSYQPLCMACHNY